MQDVAMDNQTKLSLSRLHVIRTHLHPTWYLAVVLITVILVTEYPGDYPLLERVAFGLFGSLVFLVSTAIVQILVNIVTLLLHVPVRNTILFVFGGIALVPEDSTHPRLEIIRVLVTFLLNLVVAGIFNWLYLIQPTGSSPVILQLQWLTFFWYAIALFHILSVYPLAGGRIMAAIIWKATDNYLGSMRLATRMGWLLGIGLILGSLVL
jgi:hypothetical protein